VTAYNIARFDEVRSTVAQVKHENHDQVVVESFISSSTVDESGRCEEHAMATSTAERCLNIRASASMRC
jgi:hypothetical protein